MRICESAFNITMRRQSELKLVWQKSPPNIRISSRSVHAVCVCIKRNV